MVYGCIVWSATDNLTVIQVLLNARKYANTVQDNLLENVPKLGIYNNSIPIRYWRETYSLNYTGVPFYMKRFKD